MAKQDIELKKCITPEFYLSFPHLDKPNGYQGNEPKFSAVMLFDEKTDLTALKKAALHALKDQFGEDKTKWPKSLRSPFRDGNEKSDREGYANRIYVTASSKKAPGIVDQKLQPVLDVAGAFYPGCRCRAQVLAYAYDKAGNRGSGFTLLNIQKIGDGQPFTGRQSAEDVFTAVEVDDNDASFDSPESYGAPVEDDDIGF